MKQRHTIIGTGLALGLLGCNESAPSRPTWNDDVRPIVQGNCVRCHAAPTIGGAPRDFRLDVYADTVREDGSIVRGAEAMAPFMAVRAGVLGQMPPDFPRSDAQRDTFVNWNDEGAPLGGDADDNARPTAELRTELDTVDREVVELEIITNDNDGDLISGRLRVAGTPVGPSLHGGRNLVSIDPKSLPEGDHELTAVLSDDIESATRSLGTLMVRHRDGAAPAITSPTLLRDALFTEADGPTAVTLRIEDADSDEGDLSVTVRAVRGRDEVVIAEDLPVAAGEASFDVDATALSSGTGWRLEAEATDGTNSAMHRFGPFIVASGTTDLGWDDVSEIFEASCLGCHPRAGIPRLAHDFSRYEDATNDEDEVTSRGVYGLRGTIYRRVIIETTMPPLSAEEYNERVGNEWSAVSESDRDQLREWLEAGAPQ